MRLQAESYNARSECVVSAVILKGKRELWQTRKPPIETPVCLSVCLSVICWLTHDAIVSQ